MHSGRIGRWWKRLLDIAISIFMIVFLLPLLILIAVAIKLDSSGPIFLKQVRRGYRNRVFTVFKFRTMVYGNEVIERVGQAKSDPRLTPVGRILRRLSIDEVPQLLNVLMGDMST